MIFSFVTILFIISFIFGTLRLLTFTKIFNSRIPFFLDSIFHYIAQEQSLIRGILFWIDIVLFYGFLGYQVYFWFNYFQILTILVFLIIILSLIKEIE